jgi:hypothetical protein
LESTRQAIEALAADPAFDRSYELLLDFRDVDCALTVTDIYDIAAFLGWPSPVLSTRRKIAVLIPDQMPFDNARFLEMCSANRRLRLGAFREIEIAQRWLEASLPEDLSPEVDPQATPSAAAIGNAETPPHA